ncbi:hypothetical protein K3495_g11718 [Podosphaera aphanis]|nr:hypothetical protein K3495_g11718 [Podosphaera aphanis]
MKKGHSKKTYSHVADAENSDNTLDDTSETSSECSDSEQCHITKEKISKTSPTSWIADTGASSHMSDQKSLFRKLIRIKRRKIKVGDGELYSDFKGTVIMACDDGSSTLLSDVLYVPKLGVNLLSARKLALAGLEGRFDDKYMYFS